MSHILFFKGGKWEGKATEDQTIAMGMKPSSFKIKHFHLFIPTLVTLFSAVIV